MEFSMGIVCQVTGSPQSERPVQVVSLLLRYPQGKKDSRSFGIHRVERVYWHSQGRRPPAAVRNMPGNLH